MKSLAMSIFPSLYRKGGTASPENKTPEEAAIGKPLSPELFSEYFADLGYDFEVFVDRNGKIYRFRRILPKNERQDGDVW